MGDKLLIGAIIGIGGFTVKKFYDAMVFLGRRPTMTYSEEDYKSTQALLGSVRDEIRKTMIELDKYKDNPSMTNMLNSRLEKYKKDEKRCEDIIDTYLKEAKALKEFKDKHNPY